MPCIRSFESSNPNPNTELPPPGQYGGPLFVKACLSGAIEAFLARQLENSDSHTFQAIFTSWSSSQTHRTRCRGIEEAGAPMSPGTVSRSLAGSEVLLLFQDCGEPRLLWKPLGCCLSSHPSVSTGDLFQSAYTTTGKFHIPYIK